MKVVSKRRLINQRYYQTHKEETLVRSREWDKDNRERRTVARSKSNQKVRVEVLTYYGNGKLACLWCGFENILALTIDHINGNGAKHRKESKPASKGGVSLYYVLRKEEYPEGFQTLCMNCQFIKKRLSRENYRLPEGGKSG